MNGRNCDIAIVGGGLSGGLIALALARHRPELRVRLIEAGSALGGNHRWSWFGSDLSPAAEDLLGAIPKVEWDNGYDVAFPAFRRHLATPYRSMSSVDFAATLQRELPGETILTRRESASLDARGVTLRDGSRIEARSVVDCRGFAPTGHLTGGWQAFMGRHLRTEAPHGIDRPTVMDARVEQIGGYRFVYVLPLGARELFIEDTYYQDAPELDRSALSARLDAYTREHGWEGETIGFETGVLPVITGGDFAAFQDAQRTDGVALAGGRGGFVHPLTSYTLPFAVETALAIAERADLPGEQLAAELEARARRHWSRMAYYRLLGAMLFGAARPERRYCVFERFYRLKEPLVERFYAGRSTIGDKLRILLGRPPISLPRAAKALVTPRPHLLNLEEREQA